MPDFLSRLAERAMGTGTVAEPLIAPQHAPGATPPIAEPPGAGAPVHESASARMDEPEATPRRAPAPADPIAEAAETLPPAHGAAPVSAAEATQAPPIAPIALPARTPPDTEKIFTSAPAVPSRVALPMSAPHEIAQPHHTVPPAHEAGADLPAPALARAERRSTAAAPKPALPAHAEAAAPVIRVTIGRVDVRAEFPARPPAPAPARRPPPTLSLEDYARERREGKR